MSDAPRSTDELAPLWRDILADLRDVFDVHFVCATFAYHAARYTRTRALVAVADSQAKCYDVWLTEPSGRATLSRWREARLASRSRCGSTPSGKRTSRARASGSPARSLS